jgi:hypothetical protein
VAGPILEQRLRQPLDSNLHPHVPRTAGGSGGAQEAERISVRHARNKKDEKFFVGFAFTCFAMF